MLKPHPENLPRHLTQAPTPPNPGHSAVPVKAGPAHGQ
jgi:hypothetical protein